MKTLEFTAPTFQNDFNRPPPSLDLLRYSNLYEDKKSYLNQNNHGVAN